MGKYNVLVLGSGGREHAISWKISQSRLLNRLYIAPGNAGTGLLGKNRDLNLLDFARIKSFVLENSVDMVIVGPEEPLVKGIHDFFLADEALKTIKVIGPQKAGAALEGSKAFAKEFMKRHGIPTASYGSFTAERIGEAILFLKSLKPPFVIKADGLAAGKGVVICSTVDMAVNELEDMLINKKFGNASEKVVIEEFLSGIELSAFAITDGNTFVMLPEAKDYKKIGEGDCGPNTGGMGSVSPVPFADEGFNKKVMERVIKPTVDGLRKEGILYSGFLFAGLMNVNGEPYVIEYNVRLGDPETEAILPRITSDLLEALIALSEGNLSGVTIDTDERTAACVMLVSGGYPGNYGKGYPVVLPLDDTASLVFHAGTRKDDKSGEVLTSGGRVIAVSSLGETLDQALDFSYNTAKKIHFRDSYYRKDIGFDLR